MEIRKVTLSDAHTLCQIQLYLNDSVIIFRGDFETPLLALVLLHTLQRLEEMDAPN